MPTPIDDVSWGTTHATGIVIWAGIWGGSRDGRHFSADVSQKLCSTCFSLTLLISRRVRVGIKPHGPSASTEMTSTINPSINQCSPRICVDTIRFVHMFNPSASNLAVALCAQRDSFASQSGEEGMSTSASLHLSIRPRRICSLYNLPRSV